MHYNGVDWIDKPKVSDGLWIYWVYNPTYPQYQRPSEISDGL